MTQHSDPHFRPGRGQKRQVITLSPETERAYNIWCGIYAERCEQARGKEVKTRVRHDLLDNLIATEGHTIGGQLISLAATDAKARPICEDTMMSGLHEKWVTVQLLSEAQTQLSPAPKKLPVDDSCRHGVAFTDSCQSCDNEMDE